MHSQYTAESILNEFAKSYLSKSLRNTPQAIQIDLPEGESWSICITADKKMTLQKGSHPEAKYIFKTSLETLIMLYQGDLAPITAAGRARSSDPAPLDILPGKNVQFIPGSEEHLEMLAFLQHFFNRFEPERILLGEEHSRLVHGGHVVGLYYDKGLRSAWYMLKKGERLNNPQDTNPFPQAFIFLSGKGTVQIGDSVFPVQGGEAYTIPPGSVHMIWTEEDEPLELIFLAWGEGA